MRTFASTFFIILGTVLVTAPAIVQAQAPKAAPPTMQKLEEGEAPAVTIRAPGTPGTFGTPGTPGAPKSSKKITEKREQGVVTEVQVQSGKSNYRLKQSAGAGNAAAGDAQSNTVRAAQFTIKEFDLGRKPVAPNKEDASLQPAPPSATLPGKN